MAEFVFGNTIGGTAGNWDEMFVSSFNQMSIRVVGAKIVFNMRDESCIAFEDERSSFDWSFR